MQWLLAVDAFLLIGALSLTSITDPGPAGRALGRTAAILTEVDSYLDGHYATIQKDAAQTQDGQLMLPDFPLPVSFSPQEVRSSNREQFRSLLLARSAALLRHRGAAAFRTDGSSGSGLVSAQAPIRPFIDLLRPTPHRWLGIATGVLAVLAALLALRIAIITRRFDALSRIGRPLLISAGLFMFLAIAVSVALALAGRAAGDYTTHEFLSLAAVLAWAAVLDAAIVCVFSAVMLAMGAAIARSDRRTLARPLDKTTSAR